LSLTAELVAKLVGKDQNVKNKQKGGRSTPAGEALTQWTERALGGKGYLKMKQERLKGDRGGGERMEEEVLIRRLVVPQRAGRLEEREKRKEIFVKTVENA